MLKVEVTEQHKQVFTSMKSFYIDCIFDCDTKIHQAYDDEEKEYYLNAKSTYAVYLEYIDFILKQMN